MTTSKPPELTTRNLAILNDQLGAEALLVHKFDQAAQFVQDLNSLLFLDSTVSTMKLY